MTDYRITDNSKEYISLTDAMRCCDYSQEYLSLRARQGKLKALKFGRNWVTKREWLEEYLRKNGERSNITKLTNSTLNDSSVFAGVRPLQSQPASKVRFLLAPTPTLLVVGVLLLAGIAFGTVPFKSGLGELNSFMGNVYRGLDPAAVRLNETIDIRLSDIGDKFILGSQEFLNYLAMETENLGERMANLFPKNNRFMSAGISGSPIQIAKQFFSWLGEELKSIPKKIVEMIYRPAPKIVEKNPSPEITKEGMLVIPSTDKDEEVKKKISESFSDEVKVEPQDETSGAIIPVFKEGEGEKYLYILVPVKN